MPSMTYIGLDIHKKTISFCVKDLSGTVLSEGRLSATRQGLEEWRQTLPAPWTVAMEATMFTGWIYDYLRPHAAAIKVAHPLMLRAIAVAKKKERSHGCGEDRRLPPLRLSARVLHGADGNPAAPAYPALPEAAGPAKRPVENKIAQMLMESGVSYNKEKLHQQSYFHQVLPTNWRSNLRCGRC